MGSKQKGQLLLMFIFLTAFHFFCQGQENITAETVVNNFIKLSLNNLSPDQLKVTGAKAVGIHDRDSVDIYVLKMPPDKLYMKLTAKNKDSFEIIYNTGKAIYRAKGQVTAITDSIMLEQMAANSFTLADMAYEILDYAMTLVPAEPIEGDVYKVELVSRSGTKTIKYYDKKTGYLTKVIHPDGSISFFTDYFTTDGFTTSRKEKDISKTGLVSEVYIKQFFVNPPVDASIFNISSGK